jgi:hypothetical protein
MTGAVLSNAAYFDPTSNDVAYRGSFFLAWGWLGPTQPGFLVGWYANPLWLLAFVLLARGRTRAAQLAAVSGFVVALDSIRIAFVGLSDNEGGVVTDRLSIWGPGFYLWLASFAVIMIGARRCDDLLTT